MDVMKKVPVREQAPDIRNKNFDEVCLGYNKEEAMEEAISVSDAEAYAISAQDARIFNANLESEVRASESIWIGVYSFDYATAHFEELYISIPDIPSF